jgi:hypothetical protein
LLRVTKIECSKGNKKLLILKKGKNILEKEKGGELFVA